MMGNFNFELGSSVVITVSGETGSVIARAEYINSDPQYLVRYKNGQGCALESWWTKDALSSTGFQPEV